MRVRWRLTKARHVAISFEVIEWSEQLRSVTSVWLGAAAVGFESDSAQSDPESVSDGCTPKLATKPFLLKWSSGVSS